MNQSTQKGPRMRWASHHNRLVARWTRITDHAGSVRATAARTA